MTAYYCEHCDKWEKATTKEAENEKNIPWTARKCSECQVEFDYDKGVDSYFCKICDTWNEDQCNDPECNFCVTRPARPSDRNKKNNDLEEKK
jgi:hypothetical protein